ncbi:uncharacterized protein LOC127412291 isoform X2 [Myxocyprinus asiaticus]|uniref:uncharacterized protein LOC127412291 isoform X2 n=1 Tax=Myxocyprinus asiaticus TaxID=70543 RepID=UPI00222171DA|nr:uncharacterized protein LOC127412291 isoform X2 [Myxocyprinus asiaticus]
MGKNRKKRGKGIQNAQLPGPGPQHGVRPAAPAPPLPKNCWSRPPPRRGGFRGPTPRHPMGPPGQRFPGPPHDFGPKPSKMRKMDNMAKHRQSVSVHNMPPPGKACPPQSQKKKDQLASKDSKIEPSKTMAPKLAMFKNISANTPHGRSLGVISFIGNYGGIIEREDLKKFSFVFDAFIGKRSNLVPGVKVHFTTLKNLGKECAVDVKVAPRGTEDIGNTVYEGVVTTALPDNMPPPGKACPPQSQKKKDQLASKDTKIEPSKTMAPKLAMFKNISANTPRGRSLGVISFIGNYGGIIEREDLKKFSFVFDAFIGKRSNLVPGVKVHFTTLKNLGKECAVDVKVAPRGTEDIGNTVYEGVVTTALPDNMPPPGKACPPQSQKKKDQLASKDTKIEPSKTMASKLAMFKNISANTPRGQSLGVISFIGNYGGIIEREDLKKFSFVFDAFIGKRSNLVPGVKVHFTTLKNLGKECAVDVKVAPRGTEDIDNTVYEGVVTTALPDGNVKEPNPGCIRTILSVDPIKLPFEKQDTNVTLLLYDRVEFQLLTDLITKEKRATNIKPKTPETFQFTKEIREMGVIINKTDGTLTITTEKHNNLTASAADNLSEDELNAMDEVELTVITVDDTKKAVRLKKLPVGSVTFNQQANGTENISGVKDKMPGTAPVKDKLNPVTSEAGSQELVDLYDVSSEKYEGTIVKIVPKNSKTQEMVQMDKQEPAFGLLVTKVEGTEKCFSFKSGDVITKATMMVGDEVQFNISTNSITKEECAVNLEILPDTFQMESEEQRKIGLVVKLDDNSGFVKTQQDPQIFFDMSEVMEETKLSLYEKVEFTLVPNEAAGEGNRAVRIRRLNESVFSSAPKLEAFGVKEKKKMTIKLLKDTKDYIKEEVKAEDKSSESMDVVKLNKENDKALPPMTLKNLKKESEMKKEKTKPKGDLAQSRSRGNSRRRYSRSRSKSHSRERSSSYYRRRRSSSREKMDSRYRRSRSRDRSDRYRWSRSRSRERSSRMARKRSHSPDDGDDRYKKQSSIKEKIAQNPEDSVREEFLRKRRELMELKELIAHKKAIVAMEQNVKKIEPEVEIDIERGITTFDYQHVHWENMWMPDLKPVKSILKKQSELPDPQSQVSTCKETAFVKSESLDMQMGCRQRISAFDLNASPYSKFESDSKKSLTTEGSEKIPLPEFEDPVLVRKKKRLEELSESIARKIAIIAVKQKTKAFRDAPAMEKEYEFDSHSDDQFVMSKENLWSSDIKTDVQPKKSILKKHSELLSSQSETTSVDYYGQASQDDLVFTKLPSQSTAAALFNRSSNPQPVHSDTLGLFNRLLKESLATMRVTEPSPFNKPVVPQLVMQASNLWSLHDPKPSSMSKGCNSQDDQHRASSRQTNEHPHSSNPSTSQAAPLEQKRRLTTQMERFLSALNKADSSIVNSLFHEARKDQALMSTQKPSQPQLNMNIPFRDELYDPFKEDEDDDQHPFIGRGVGKHSVREQIKSPVKRESHFYDPSKDDHLSNERAVQDGSRFSWLIGMKEDFEPNKDIFRDEHKVEDVVLTTLKRTIMNLKSTKDAQKSSKPSFESTTVSQVSYQPASMYVVSTAQPGSSQYAQISTIPTLSTSLYSYHSNEKNLGGSACPLDSSQNTNLQYSAYPYGTVPLPPNLGYASAQQAMAPHMMSSYSSYPTQMDNPYSAHPPRTMPIPYGLPPMSNPLLSSMNSSYTTLHAGQNLTDKKTQPVRSLKTTETIVTTVNVKGEPKGIPKKKVNNRPAKSLHEAAEMKLVSTTIKDDIKAKQNKRTRLRRIQRRRARRRLNYMKQAI